MEDRWAGIYGHRHNREVLDTIIKTTQVPHALLFSGKEGIGKDFISIRFAQLINKSIAPQNLIQQILIGISNLSEPYIKYIFPLPRGRNEDDDSTPFEKLSISELDAIKEALKQKVSNPYYHIKLDKANNIKISSMRDINRFLSLQYETDFFRFILISDAHLMNEISQNALLKNLEEPPEKVIFILTTPFPELLRETIRSRCWSLHFSPLSNSDVSKILIKYFKVEDILANEVSVFSDGSIATAMKLLDSGFSELKNKTISFLRYSLGKKFTLAYNEISEFLKNSDSQRLKIFIFMIISWLNDLQKHRILKNNFFFDDHKETLEKFNKKFPDANVNDIVIKLDRLSSLLDNNINPNLIVMNMIYNIASLTK